MKKIDVSVLSELLEEHALEELRQNRIRIKEILIHQNGEEVYHRVFGASPENGKTNGKPMLFRAASMTKPITSAAVAQLADAGLLDLKSPACRYFPKMERMNVAEIKNGKITSLHPAQNTILIEDLLCHT
ncbi:MAG: beta-lactamase family protein, partial [Clostridia bacterium]|nr:beta-lactamase family protein [Clostridia bacterium]